VDGGHTYTKLGNFQLKVTVVDKGGSRTIAAAEVDVAPAVNGGIPIGDVAIPLPAPAPPTPTGAEPSTPPIGIAGARKARGPVPTLLVTTPMDPLSIHDAALDQLGDPSRSNGQD
jgi:hypothetical protein